MGSASCAAFVLYRCHTFTPESAAQSRTIAITDEASDTPEAVVTDTPEITPAEVPTDTPTPETAPEETATPTPNETPTPEPTKEAGEMKVHFLDVGQGLKLPQVFDGGDDLIHVLLGGHACVGGLVLDLLAVLVGAGQEHDRRSPASA